ncbi:MAG TPA: Rrf2 family transcriptional regulator [Terriglobia bacterium]|nr:Rrf2 family transcriptional regulator [Terriglobia bacterium]
MQLTLHADYAFRTLIYLGAQPEGQLVSTEQISQSYGISKHHLVRVVQTLNQHGLVKVYPGRSGGISLARDAGKIRLGDVMRVAETNLKVVECFDMETNTCPIVPVCQLKPVLAEALNAFLSVLDKYTLADLLDPRRRNSLTKLFALSNPSKSR